MHRDDEAGLHRQDRPGDRWPAGTTGPSQNSGLRSPHIGGLTYRRSGSAARRGSRARRVYPFAAPPAPQVSQMEQPSPQPRRPRSLRAGCFRWPVLVRVAVPGTVMVTVQLARRGMRAGLRGLREPAGEAWLCGCRDRPAAVMVPVWCLWRPGAPPGYRKGTASMILGHWCAKSGPFDPRSWKAPLAAAAGRAWASPVIKWRMSGFRRMSCGTAGRRVPPV